MPSSSEVPIAALAGLFNQVTNSYKFLYFFALLDAVTSRAEPADGVCNRTFDTKDIAVRALVRAWYPHTFFRLSFGRQDKVAALLDALSVQPDTATPGRRQRQELQAAIDARISDQQVAELSRYVPTRLIRPFFAREQLRGTVDSRVDERLASLSRDGFDERRPLYRVDEGRRSVTVHPTWARYLRTHAAIVEGWAQSRWTEYMQLRNPNVPAVSSKLVPHPERTAIPSRVREFWTLAHRTQGGLLCPYTKAPVPESFSLDHFVPWTFVAHDQPWNLVPVSPEVNSAKGNRLPDEVHIDALIDRHAEALVAAQPQLRKGRWSHIVDAYVADLGVCEASLLRAGAAPGAVAAELRPLYLRSVRPLLELARGRGFERWDPATL